MTSIMKLSSALLITFSLALSSIAYEYDEDCDDIVEDFVEGTFQIFNASCPGFGQFDIAKYQDVEDVEKPAGANDYFATAEGPDACFTHSDPIDVIAGSEVTVSLYKNVGFALCIATIVDAEGGVIFEDEAPIAQDEVWSNVTYRMDREDRITIQFECIFIGVSRISIDFVSVTKRCQTTEEPSTTTPQSTTEEPPSTTPAAITTTTTIATTTTEFPPGCGPIRDDFADGVYKYFTEECSNGAPKFDIRRYTENEEIPPPDDRGNDHYAAGTAEKNCIVTADAVEVKNGNTLVVSVYTFRTPALCVVRFLNEANGEVGSEVLGPINTAGWSNATVNLTFEDTVKIELSCDLFERMNIAIDYIELKNRCL